MSAGACHSAGGAEHSACFKLGRAGESEWVPAQGLAANRPARHRGGRDGEHRSDPEGPGCHCPYEEDHERTNFSSKEEDEAHIQKRCSGNQDYKSRVNGGGIGGGGPGQAR